MNRTATIVAGLSLAFVGTSATYAATINVPGDLPFIYAAINLSVNGDVINIAAGTYYEGNLNPQGKAITIQGTLNGDGTLATIIDAQSGPASVFVFNSGETSGTVIKDLVITRGSAILGGGIMCSGSPTITNCTISNNQAYSNSGGGIFINGSPIITDCTISDNSANWGGGVCVQNPGNPTLSGCTVSGNTAGNGAGGIFIAGQLTLSDSCVSMNFPEQINGNYTNGGGNEITSSYPCGGYAAGDVDQDGDVDLADLVAMRAALGLCKSDVDSDYDTDVMDLLWVIDGWNTVCP